METISQYFKLNESKIPKNHKPSKVLYKESFGDFVSHASYSTKENLLTVNKVVRTDFQALMNADLHKTINYYLIHKNPPELVVRRDQHDRFTTVCQAFLKPMVPNTFDDFWTAVISKISRNGLSAEVILCANVNCRIGKYLLSCSMSFNGEEKNPSHKNYIPFFVIFNPWHTGESVYLPNSSSKDEYVLREIGTIFRGCVSSVEFSYWKFSQFQPEVLEASLLLGSMHGKIKDWGNVVDVVLGITNAVQTPNGIIETNYTGNYKDGINPTHWSGTCQIINKWYKERKIIKYGQSYVHGGILTGVFRSLGIPSRIITGFNCSSNADEHCTVDFIFSPTFEKRTALNPNGEAYWSYNVWSEVWIKRPDLGYNCGWNAVAANTGPCSLNSIKQKKYSAAYNTMFFYNLINANIFDWNFRKNQPISLISYDTTRIGRILLTKKVNSFGREDVTDLYKCKEKNIEERKTNGLNARHRHHMFQDWNLEPPNPDIRVFCTVNSIKYGQDMTVKVEITNKSKMFKEIYCVVQLVSCRYNGVPIKEIKTIPNEIDLERNSSKEIDVCVEFLEYVNNIEEDNMFKAYAIITCGEDEYVEYKHFVVAPPPLHLHVMPIKPVVGNTILIRVNLYNPGSIDLIGSFTLEEMDIDNITSLPQITIEPDDEAVAAFQMYAHQPGMYYLIVKFIGNITTMSTILMNIKQ